MLIKLIAETDAEKKRMKEQFNSDKVVHKNVREYLIFGIKKTDGGLNDFHEWAGSYRYLMSNLAYFTEIVNDERKNQEAQPMTRKPLNLKNGIHLADVDEDEEIGAEDEIIDADVIGNDKTNFVKRGTVNQQNIIHMRPEDLEIITQKLNKENKAPISQDDQDQNLNHNVDNEDCDIPPAPPIFTV